MFGANLSIDLHKRSRISADDTNQGRVVQSPIKLTQR